jgi:hypothetical protein
MSHPSINRWGLNLFWYRFWFNDKINALMNHQDHLLDKFILIYLHYGLLNYKNLFISKYWYLTENNFLTTHRAEVFTKYFRVIEYKNRTLNEHKSYRLRIKVKNLYYSKIWILRYQNWIIINFYSFQPLKKKLLKKKKTKKHFDTYLSPFNQNNSYFFRYKLIFYLFFNLIMSKQNYYNF